MLYTIPGANEWTIVLSKNLKAQGLSDHKPQDEAARVTSKPVTLASPVETFTIGFEDLRADSAIFYLEWDKTRVPVKLMTNDVEKVNKGIDSAVKERQAARGRILLQRGKLLFGPEQRYAPGVKVGRSSPREKPESLFHASEEGADSGQDGQQKRSDCFCGKSNRNTSS